MRDIKDIPDDDLKAELERRAQPPEAPPQPLPNPDFSNVIKTVTEGLQYTLENGYENDDFPEYVYEAAMEAVYGPRYWAWRRKQKY